jgi:UDP-3-O-[3-hydroxymyristoyl] glucosamine N-acyltransferase
MPMPSGVSPSAYIDRNVKLGLNVIIYPNAAVLGPCAIGDNTTVGAGVVVGAEGQEFHRNNEGRLQGTLHEAGVIIGNNVDIRANTTIQRGVSRPTAIDDGTKIGPNCNIGHEVRIGRDVLITGMVMIAGSTEVGDRVYIGPHTIVGSGLKIGNDVSIRIGSLVLNDIQDGLTVAGRPAEAYEAFKRHREELKRLLDGSSH